MLTSVVEVKNTFPRRKNNFRKAIHITFFIVILTTALGGIIANVLQWKNQESVYDNISLQITEDKKNEVEYIIRYVERKFNNLTRLLEKIRNPDSLFNEKNHLRENLMGAFGLIPAVSSVYIGDTKGRFLAVPSLELETGLTPGDRPWFVRPTDDLSSVKYSGGYRDLQTGKRVFSVSRALFIKNGYYAVIGMDVNLLSLGVLYEKMRHTMPADLYILDEHGALVIGDEKRWQNLPQQSFTALEGNRGVLSHALNGKRFYYSKMRDPHWTVLMAVDDKVLAETLYRESVLPAITLLTMLLFLLFCWWRSLEILQIFYFNLLNKLKGHSTSVDNLLEEQIRKSSSELGMMENSAKTDGLTGLLNRRVFDRDLHDALKRPDSPVSLAMVDIDNFKLINDTYGHLIGDDVLRVFASMAIQSLESDAIRVYRYGGEEFAILFQGLSFAEAKRALETFRHAFAARKWRDNLSSVSFSAGIKQWEGEKLAPFVAAVDKLLYRAKESGKNNINGDGGKKDDNQ